MNNENKTLLDKEIKMELESLESMDLGTDEYKVAVDGVTKLMDKSIEMTKLEINAKDKALENDFKQKQMKNEKRHQIIGYAMNAAGIIVPVVVTIWGTIVTLEFEKEGTVTTMPGKSFINRLFKK